MRAIDADKLREKKVLVYSCFGAEAEGVLLEDIDTAPTISSDSLVKRGRWIHTDMAWSPHGKDECSECRYAMADRVDLSYFKFCPNCGADMRGKQNE